MPQNIDPITHRCKRTAQPAHTESRQHDVPCPEREDVDEFAAADNWTSIGQLIDRVIVRLNHQKQKS